MKLHAPVHWQSRLGLAPLLYPVSLLFSALVWLRRLCFRAGLLKSTTVTVPVVVVGNITVGGAGKTPLVIALVEQLKATGWQPAVVSRGYGGSTQVPTLVDVASDHNIVGDEALMLARRTGVPVAVCAKRVAAVELLTTYCDCDVIVSDDGLQHYALDRQVEICVIDGVTGLGNWWCLPAGPLREPPSRLREVDLIVFSGKADTDKGKDGIRQTINKWLDESSGGVATASSANSASGALVSDSGHSDSGYSDSDPDTRPSVPSGTVPVLAAYSVQVEAVVNLQNPTICRRLAEFAHCQVHAVAAIGRPDKFFRQLRAAGLDIIEHAFSDHHVFELSDLTFDDELDVLMTEKDSVKCDAWGQHNFWTVNVVAELDHGIVDAVLDQLPHRGTKDLVN